MMLLQKPTPGTIVSIYKENGEFEFEAFLIKKSAHWRTLEPFVWEQKKPEIKNINAVKENWIVQVISTSPFENGKIYNRWINKFHSIGLIKVRDNEDTKNI